MALDDWFIEIQQQKNENNFPEHIDCYILVNIDPKCCGNLARDLNAILPLRDVGQSIDNTDDVPIKSEQVKLPATSHLKRIRRRAATVDELELIAHNTTRCQNDALANGGNDPNENGHVCMSELPQEGTSKKRAKNNGTLRTWSLDILVGSIAAVGSQLNGTRTLYQTNAMSNTSTLESILSKYDMSKTNLVRQSLPGRPAETKEELQQWNANLWPTLFFEKKTDQFKEEELQLSIEETYTMIEGMRAAVQDAIVGRRKWKEYKTAILCRDDITISFPGCDISGVVVMNPQSSSIVSRASDERVLQSGNNAFPDEQNPLCTSTILAIQGVSRAERQNALGHGMESKEFKRGQYLCTGYDVYLTKEPNAYEAMALVHSRVRRVIFGTIDRELGGLGGVQKSTMNGGIHCLPGTNHHYRAFRLNTKLDGGDDEDQPIQSLIGSIQDLHADS